MRKFIGGVSEQNVKLMHRGLAVEQGASGIGMSGVVGGLLDEVERHPSQVDRYAESEQDMCRRVAGLTSEAGNEGRDGGGSPDGCVRESCALPVARR